MKLINKIKCWLWGHEYKTTYCKDCLIASGYNKSGQLGTGSLSDISDTVYKITDIEVTKCLRCDHLK